VETSMATAAVVTAAEISMPGLIAALSPFYVPIKMHRAIVG
jgi:hypothetical protein